MKKWSTTITSGNLFLKKIHSCKPPAVKAAYERAKGLLEESVFNDTHEIGAYINENRIRFTLGAFGTHKAMNRIKAYKTRYYELRERLYHLRVCVSK